MEMRWRPAGPPNSALQATASRRSSKAYASVLAKEVRCIDDAITRGVSDLEQIAAGGGMAHRQNQEVVCTAQQDDRIQSGEVALADSPVDMERAPLQYDRSLCRPVSRLQAGITHDATILAAIRC